MSALGVAYDAGNSDEVLSLEVTSRANSYLQRNGEFNSGPCNVSGCRNCRFMKVTNTFKSTATGKKFRIKHTITCKTSNVIYIMQCKKRYCKKQYVGETRNSLGDRMNDHRSQIRNASKKTLIANHFSHQHHGIENLEIIGIEIPSLKEKYDSRYEVTERLGREKYWQRKLRTIAPDGMNVERRRGAPGKIKCL